MTKFKLPLIIGAVLLALVAGLFVSGIIGGKDPDAGKKHVVEPVALAEDITVNTADTDKPTYAVIGLALQLEPMPPKVYANFSGAGAAPAAGEMSPGATKLATYPKFRDAIIEVASGFKAADLNSASGKKAFKEQLLDRFAKIAEVDEAEHKSSPADPATEGIEPPYHVMDITFTKLATQAN